MPPSHRDCPCPPIHRPAYVLQTCAHTCTHTCTHGPIHVFTCACVVCTYACTYAHTCPCVPTLMCVHAPCAHMNVHVRSLMCAHTRPSTSSHVCALCACTCADTCPCMSQQSLTVCAWCSHPSVAPSQPQAPAQQPRSRWRRGPPDSLLPMHQRTPSRNRLGRHTERLPPPSTAGTLLSQESEAVRGQGASTRISSQSKESTRVCSESWEDQ